METGSNAVARPVLSVPGWTDFLSGLQARHPGLWIKLGNLESRMLDGRLSSISIDKPVWVTGLARAGTTILLEILARHPDFASHRYRDFPPVLAVWSWNWFVDRADTAKEAARERAHGDGIMVTAESPEAFEEVVWMAFFPDLHNPDANVELAAQDGDSRFEEFYRDHIRKILLLRGGTRYLAKANYNVTRLAYLIELFPDARFIVPFRNPLRHIASLMSQHRRFREEHERDDRLRRHMSRVGHFEFGLDRTPINHGDLATTKKVLGLWADGHEVEGWAMYWRSIHAYIADCLASSDVLRKGTLLIDYDRFCAAPTETIRELMAHIELDSAGYDLIDEATRIIRPPSHRALPFSDREQALIEDMTIETWTRLREMAGNR
jgi:hypothetical protein